jgi:hypothetical protein
MEAVYSSDDLVPNLFLPFSQFFCVPYVLLSIFVPAFAVTFRTRLLFTGLLMELSIGTSFS